MQNGTPQGEIRGFLWTPQLGAVDLALPLGVTDPATIVTPFGINDRGQIVGELINSPLHDAFVWDSGPLPSSPRARPTRSMIRVR